MHHAPGQYAKGAAILADALGRGSEDAVLLYDLACFESLSGQTEAALAHVQRSLELDPSLRAGIAVDPDFTAIAGDPRFRALVGL